MTRPHLKKVTVWRASARGTTHGYGPTPALAMEHYEKGRAVRASVSAWSNRIVNAEHQLRKSDELVTQMTRRWRSAVKEVSQLRQLMDNPRGGLQARVLRLQMAYDTLRAEWDKRYLDQPPKGTIR